MAVSQKNKVCVTEATIVRKLSLRNLSLILLLLFSGGLLMDAQMHEAWVVSALYSNTE